MALKIIDGAIYLSNPKTLSLNSEFVEFNPEKPEVKYEALKLSIKDNGQLQPIFIDSNGLVLDGRHRIIACSELGIDVECVNIKATATKQEILEACNTNEFTGRELNATQKAFKVMDMCSDYGYTQTIAMAKMGFKNTKSLSAVNFLYNNPTYRNAYVDILKNGDSINIYFMNDETGEEIAYRGSSLQKIHQILKEIEEIDLKNIEPKEGKAEDRIDYNELIDTEIGKAEFWDKWGTKECLQVNDKLMLIDYINMKYQK